MTDAKILCDVGCGAARPERDMYRLTRRPDEPEETIEVRELGQAEPVGIVVSGPEHWRICPDCWQAATGFLETLQQVRERRRA